MKLGSSHLTYCTNIHPGESWAEVRANLERYLPAVKARVCPDLPFGVGLRLSNAAAIELVDRLDCITELEDFLRKHDLYVFTINGFPYGTFHGLPVKAAVYQPDWLETATGEGCSPRGRYTDMLAHILARLLPEGMTGSISTVPGYFRSGPGDPEGVARSLARCTAELASIERRYDRHIVLALEPEPACMLETVAETIAFFNTYAVDRHHLGICLDACHAAVEFEDLPVAVAQLRAAEIQIAKVQLSCGLQIAPVDDAARRELARYAEDVYLHQVVARRAGVLTRYVDLPDALADPAVADEWRIHFHVPIFRAELGPFASTQTFLAALLAEHKRAEISPHLEVETYTWDVLPPEFRAEPIEDAIARELSWVVERLA